MLLLLSAPVDACIGRMMPFKDKPELYSDIFEATVMMVEITGSSFSIGFSPKHTLTVEIKETLKGNKAGTITIENITGCGVPVPEVGQSTTFYLMGKIAVPDLYLPPVSLNRTDVSEKDNLDG